MPILGLLPLPLTQTGDDLEFTDLENGDQWDGTISGNQVRYAQSYQTRWSGLNSDIYLEAEGTVLDAGHITVSYDLDWAFEVEGLSVTGSTVCTGRLQRAEPAAE